MRRNGFSPQSSRAPVQTTAAGGTPEQFGETIEKEIALWRKVAREAGLQPE